MSSAEDAAPPDRLGYVTYRPLQEHESDFNRKQMLDDVKDIFEIYAAQRPLTVRQVYYALIALKHYPKGSKLEGALSDLTIRARRGRLLPMDWFRDDRVSEQPTSAYRSSEGFWRSAEWSGRRYHRNLTADQPTYIEIWCEAAGMVPMLSDIADAYGIAVRGASGFTGTLPIVQTAERLLAARANGKRAVVLQFGDCDPSGHSIMRRQRADVSAFMLNEGHDLDEEQVRNVLDEEEPFTGLWVPNHPVARSLDTTVQDESGLPGTRESHLVQLFVAADLVNVEQAVLSAQRTYDTFDEWWEPFSLGVGPGGAYVAKLEPERVSELRERCRSVLPHGRFVITAHAWSVRGSPRRGA